MVYGPVSYDDGGLFISLDVLQCCASSNIVTTRTNDNEVCERDEQTPYAVYFADESAHSATAGC